MADPHATRVRLTDLVNKEVPGDIRPGTYLQRAGMKLFFWMWTLTLVILALLFIYLYAATPYVPDLSYSSPTPLDSISIARVHILAEQRQLAFDRFSVGVEKLILQFCLPLMTGILGYLFGGGGTSNRQGDTNPGDS